MLNEQIFHRQFKIMDDDRSRTLSYEEFKKGVRDFGLAVSDEVCIHLWDSFLQLCKSSHSIDFSPYSTWLQ